MVYIRPLTKDSLLEAQALAVRLFPWEDEHQAALAAATDTSSTAFLISRGLKRVRVWCVIDERDRMVGLVSLYEYDNEPDEAWLAWFGLSPEVRGCGLGGELLDGVIALARRESKTVLRLWTTIEEEYARALRLYARRGFRPEIQPALAGEDWLTVVFSLALDGAVAPPWRGTQCGWHLCGRMVRARAA
jgi:GNAT superfamily N-acetyltransferase